MNWDFSAVYTQQTNQSTERTIAKGLLLCKFPHRFPLRLIISQKFYKNHIKCQLNQDFSCLFFKAMKFRTNTILCMKITAWRSQLFIPDVVFENGTRGKAWFIHFVVFRGAHTAALKAHRRRAQLRGFIIFTS